MIGSGSAAVLLAAGLAGVVSATPAQAGDWGGCYSWTENSNKTAVGRCANVNRKWRVWAACDWQPDASSDWV